MSCETLINITKSCDNNTGGIRQVWINEQDGVTSTTVNANTWIVSAITSTAFATFEINRNTGNYTEDTAVDLINGSTFVTQTITLMFNRRDKDKSEAINVLGAGQQYLAAVVLDANGKYWYFENLQLTATGEGSGTARADGSKYSITLLAESEHLAYEIDAAIVIAPDFPPYP